jgi:hypothetical protein
METDSNSIVLIWGQGQHRHTIQLIWDTNTPVFYTAPAPATLTYRAFTSWIEAMEAQFHWQKHILQLLRRCCLLHNKEVFLAKENILLINNFQKNNTSVSERASPNSKMVQTNNLSLDKSGKDSNESEAIQAPQLEEDM